jgi:hypothetical protein
MSSADQQGTWWTELWRKNAPGAAAFEQRGIRSQAFWFTEPNTPRDCILVAERSMNAVKVAVYESGGEMPLGDAFLEFDVPLRRPLRLVPVSVPKPWGQEIWHSGVEKRGTSRVELLTPSGLSVQVPLPYVELALEIARPEHQSALVLLKELDPFDVPYYGELYTEIHLQKSEIYLVTALGPNCCPGGQGFVKLGVQPSSSGASNSDTLSKALLAVESVRKKVDALLAAGGFDFAAQVASGANGLKSLHEAKLRLVPSELREQEKQAYSAASGLFLLHEIRVGDIVRVPTHMPHALQPGVRVIEFQTPHYERMILSSNQKVMTQEAWDVDSGIRLIAEGNGGDIAEAAITRADSQNAEHVTRIVAFDGLDVLEIRLRSSELDSASQSIRITGPQQRTPFVLQVLEGNVTIEVGDCTSACAAGGSYLLTTQVFLLRVEPLAGSAARVLVASSVTLNAPLRFCSLSATMSL